MKRILPAFLITFLLVGSFLFAWSRLWGNRNVSKDNSALTENQAKKIAEQYCVKGGDSISPGIYNETTKTWWFDANLNMVREGCNPACVVDEKSGKAEINWRCTGLKEPEGPEEALCEDIQRDNDVCVDIYEPVCATVEIQCIKAPCDPIKQTFPNSCTACSNKLVRSYTEGVCE